MPFEVRIDLPDADRTRLKLQKPKSAKSIQAPLGPRLTLWLGGRFDSLRGLRPRATAPKMPPPIVVNKMPEPASTMAVSVEDLVSYVPLLPFASSERRFQVAFDRFF